VAIQRISSFTRPTLVQIADYLDDTWLAPEFALEEQPLAKSIEQYQS